MHCSEKKFGKGEGTPPPLQPLRVQDSQKHAKKLVRKMMIKKGMYFHTVAHREPEEGPQLGTRLEGTPAGRSHTHYHTGHWIFGVEQTFSRIGVELLVHSG